MIAWSRGRNIHDNEPQFRRSDSFGAFAAELDHDRASRKEDAAYFCAPFNHDGKRSKENVEPTAFLVFDIDGCPPDVLPDLRTWFAQYEGIGWPTHSSTAEDPHERAVLRLVRSVARDEAIRLGQAIAKTLEDIFPGLNIDRATFKPEQPVFMPPSGRPLARYTGEPVDVDSWLAMIQAVAPVQAAPISTDRQLIAEGGRNVELTSIAGRLRRAGLSATELEAALTQINRERCSPPLQGADVERIARSVGRYELAALPAEERKAELPIRLDLGSLAQREPAKPQFVVEDWLPRGEVTLMGAHGGTGKSMIGLQLAVSIATGKHFFGLDTQQHRVAFLSYEDSEAVLHWRLARVCRWMDVQMADIADQLAVFDGSRTLGSWFAPYKGECGPTREYFAIEEALSGFEVLIVDGSSDTFAANENDRGQVKAFIRLLKRLVPESGALLLLAHVDKLTARAGATSQGYSGSTGWHNGPRARWYVRKDEDSEDLIVELQKSNSGRSGAQIKLSWEASAHVFDGRIDGATRFDRKHRTDSTKDALMRCFRYCSAQKIDVPAATTGRRTAYIVLSECPDFPLELKKTADRAVFWTLIESLRQTRQIQEIGQRNADSKWKAYLVISDGLITKTAKPPKNE